MISSPMGEYKANSDSGKSGGKIRICRARTIRLGKPLTAGQVRGYCFGGPQVGTDMPLRGFQSIGRITNVRNLFAKSLSRCSNP